MVSFALVLAFLVVLPSCFQLTRATCKLVHKGNSTDLLLKGTLLTSSGALSNTHMLIQRGLITYVGNGRHLTHHSISRAQVLDCQNSVISPGFINTHEHIEHSTVNPLLNTGELNEHRHDWRKGLRGHTLRRTEVNGSATDATTWGELRHILSGTTSIVGGQMVPGLTRNLDFVAGLEAGLHAPVARWDVFPLDDARGVLRRGDCDYGAASVDAETAGKYHRYLAHVGEGIAAEAENEFQCLSGSTLGASGLSAGGRFGSDIIAPNLALVHALGLSEADFDKVAERGAMVVWSPRSNVFLYGKTLDVSYLLSAGITVALGTDWLPSGSATLGREAVCARDVMSKSHGVELEAKTIWEMMTINAARVAGVEKSLGSIEVGKMADIVVFGGGEEKDEFAQAVYAGSETIELVVRGGKVILAGAGLEGLKRGACEKVAFGEAEKTVCVEDEIGMSFTQLEKRLGGVYPAVIPGVPKNEPTCEATR